MYLSNLTKGFEWEDSPPEYSEREQPVEDGAAAAAAGTTEVPSVSVVVIRNSPSETENGTSERCDVESVVRRSVRSTYLETQLT